MKSLTLLGLSLACTQVMAQSAIDNPVGAVLSSSGGFIIPNQAQPDLFIFALSAQSGRKCEWVRYNVQENYIPPKEGHGIGWEEKGLTPGPLWVPRLKTNGAFRFESPITDSWSQQTVPQENAMTQKMASSSSSASSSSTATTSSVTENGRQRSRTESTSQSTVTVNGKTYRTFSHEIHETPEDKAEPQSYQQTLICR